MRQTASDWSCAVLKPPVNNTLCPKRHSHSRRMNLFRYFVRSAVSAAFAVITLSAPAAQLSGDARAALPRDIQQLVVVDYRAMQNSDAAMQLRDRVMPPDLKQFDDALRKSGINDNHDVDSLAFALYRVPGSSDQIETVGIAQGQFSQDDLVASFRKQHVKATVVRNNK